MKLRIIILILALIKIALSTTCIDGTQCPGEQKCCATKDGFNCCPYTSGVCCSDMKHCCPQGYTCNAKGNCVL